jgi:small conductance mechanosensitive channel
MDNELLNNALAQVTLFATEYGLKIVGAIIIFVVGKIVAGICAKVVAKAMNRAKADPAIVSFVSQIVKYTVLIMIIVAALQKLEVQMTSFIALIGAAGLAVGLAMQGSLSNFAAGLLILMFRPFKAGDLIKADGQTGKVQRISIFTTILHSPDNQKIIIPNAAVTGSTIINLTANDTRRVDLVASISYGDDMGKAKEVLLGMLKNHPQVLDDPAPQVEVVELADSSVNLVVRPWVRTADYWDVYFSVTQSIKETLDGAGLSIPYPQRDVHMDQVSKGD